MCYNPLEQRITGLDTIPNVNVLSLPQTADTPGSPDTLIQTKSKLFLTVSFVNF